MAKLRISSIGYTLRQGLANIWRNKMFSIASIATMAACIFMFGLFYSIVTNFQSAVKGVESDVAISVFFDEGASQADIDRIGIGISGRSEVSYYVYLSADDAWENYKDEYYDGDEEAAAAFGDDNPLENSANYQVYMNDIEDQETLVAFLESVDGVREVSQSEQVAETLTDFNRLVSIISVVIIIILICVAIFLISNTVRTGISVRKEEIGIMKMIGATDLFVRAPFIVEGVFIGVIGSIIPLIVLHRLYGNIITYISTKFSFLANMIDFMPTADIFAVLIPVSLILGIGIGYLGSRVTVFRHIHV